MLGERKKPDCITNPRLPVYNMFGEGLDPYRLGYQNPPLVLPITLDGRGGGNDVYFTTKRPTRGPGIEGRELIDPSVYLMVRKVPPAFVIQTFIVDPQTGFRFRMPVSVGGYQLESWIGSDTDLKNRLVSKLRRRSSAGPEPKKRLVHHYHLLLNTQLDPETRDYVERLVESFADPNLSRPLRRQITNFLHSIPSCLVTPEQGLVVTLPERRFLQLGPDNQLIANLPYSESPEPTVQVVSARGEAAGRSSPLRHELVLASYNGPLVGLQESTWYVRSGVRLASLEFTGHQGLDRRLRRLIESGGAGEDRLREVVQPFFELRQRS